MRTRSLTLKPQASLLVIVLAVTFASLSDLSAQDAKSPPDKNKSECKPVTDLLSTPTNVQDAKDKLSNDGFTGILIHKPELNTNSGTSTKKVVGQHPAPGHKYETGRNVHIWISGTGGGGGNRFMAPSEKIPWWIWLLLAMETVGIIWLLVKRKPRTS